MQTVDTTPDSGTPNRTEGSAGVAGSAGEAEWHRAAGAHVAAGSHRAPGLHRAPGRSLGSYLAGGLANLLAAGGMVAVGLVIAAVTMNISLIMFKTGSMSPTIPTGSVAVVKQISADEIRVGDVVTVDRPGRLPVTHRVIELQPQVPGEALILMQGDANPTPDPGMYRVETVRKVLWSVPELAKVIVWAGNPLVMGSITLLAALGVLWTFWPRNTDEDDEDKDDDDSGFHGAGRAGRSDV